MIWKTQIILRDGTEINMVSAIAIKATMLEATEMAVFVGEHDTIGVPLDQLKSFHIYELGLLN